MRYFHQSPDYWLDHCTVQDWVNIWSRELIESPPVDDWAAVYFKHEPPHAAPDLESADPAESEIWECPLPDVTE